MPRKMASGLSKVQQPLQSKAATTLTATTTTLGGIQSGNGSEKKNVKDEQLPDELNTLVNQLRDYIKKQKNIKEEIERHSKKSFKKISDETNKLRKDVSLASSGIQKDASAVESLKDELSQELINAEIAQQTSNTPLAFQHENTAPQEYFQRLVESFEERMHSYKRQVEEVESHLASLQQPQIVSPQAVLMDLPKPNFSLLEISVVMKKLHETFITLAARMHATHEAVKLEKERYLAYRERTLGDRTNIFQRRTGIAEQKQCTSNSSIDASRTSLGPSPFALHNNTSRSYTNPAVQGGVKTGMTAASSFPLSLSGNTTSFGASTPFAGSSFGSTSFGASMGFGTSSGFGLTSSSLSKSIGSSGFGSLGSTTATPFGGSTTSLQLQKPPLGNKRGKK